MVTAHSQSQDSAESCKKLQKGEKHDRLSNAIRTPPPLH